MNCQDSNFVATGAEVVAMTTTDAASDYKVGIMKTRFTMMGYTGRASRGRLRETSIVNNRSPCGRSGKSAPSFNGLAVGGSYMR